MTEKEVEKLAIAEAKKTLGEKYILWFPHKLQFVRFDIFSVFDFIALNTENGAVHFYQITTSPNRASRRKKIEEFLQYNDVQRGHFWLWAWDKKEARFKKESFR